MTYIWQISNFSVIVLSFLYIRYEKAVQKATNDLASLKYTEGSYEQSEETTRNLKVQVIIVLENSLILCKNVKYFRGVLRWYHILYIKYLLLNS